MNLDMEHPDVKDLLNTLEKEKDDTENQQGDENKDANKEKKDDDKIDEEKKGDN